MYADPTLCPSCRAHFDRGQGSCGQCGLPLTGPKAAAIFEHLSAADSLIAELQASVRLNPGRAVVSTPAAASAAAAPSDTPHSATPPPPHASFLTPHPAAGAVGPRPRNGLSAASVPRILLGLGALCLLVAALVFLAVAWSWLGVGGRTAVLIALTVAAAGLAALMVRRGLLWAAESLSVVAVGFVAFDVVGAANAGWLGDGDGWLVTVLVGVMVAIASLVGIVAVSRTQPPLKGLQILTVLGVFVAGRGLSGLLDSDSLPALIACVSLGLLAVLGARLHRTPVNLLSVLSGVGCALWWVALVRVGIAAVNAQPSVRELWLQAAGWPLLAGAAVLSVAAWTAARWLPQVPIRAWSLAYDVALTLVGWFAVGPMLDESANRRTAALLVAVLCSGVLLLLTRTRSITLGAVPLVAAGLWPLGRTLLESVYLFTGIWAPVWSRSWSARTLADPTTLQPLLIPATWGLIMALTLALLRRTPRTLAALLPVTVGVMVTAVASVLIAYDAPRAVTTAVLALPAAALLIAAQFVAPPTASSAPTGLPPWPTPLSSLAAASGAGLLALSVWVALPSLWLTLALSVLTLGVGIVVLVIGRDLWHRLWAEALTPVAIGSAVVSVAALIEVDPGWRGLIVVAALSVALVVRSNWIWLASSSAVAIIAGLWGLAAAQDGIPDDANLIAALTLTVAGAAYVVVALLRPDRRLLAALGGALLALASWVRLADAGVSILEAYTLPSALVLVAVGWWHLRTHPAARTRFALSPGLTLATVPSLLHVIGFGDTASWRALALGLACLALVLGGVTLRWSAPLVIGAVVGAILVLLEAWPVARVMPPWILIAWAGALLTFVGITWEKRLRDLRSGGAWLARLR